ncbi:MAG: RNA polymerase sigma factor [Gemmataceae bacterium]
MASDSDRLLIQQIRQGDSQAWQTLISRYEGRLLAYVQRRLRDRSTSEDVVQETFVGFLNSLPNFDDRRELQTYLFTIASHKLTDHLRKSGRHPLRSLPEGNDDLLDQQYDDAPTASSRVRSDEREELERAALTRCLGQILRSWQEKGDFVRLKVMELLWVKGWANRDVAAFLKISEQQVANYRFAAVKKLSELIRAAGLSADVFPELQGVREE